MAATGPLILLMINAYSSGKIYSEVYRHILSVFCSKVMIPEVLLKRPISFLKLKSGQSYVRSITRSVSSCICLSYTKEKRHED